MSSSDSDLNSDAAGLTDMLPPKSKAKYLQVYETFMKWKKENQKDSLEESVFLDYFTKLAKERKPTSLWSIFSMLKSTVRVKHNIYIQNYANLTWFLKRKSQGYKSVSSKTLTEENIKKYINDAPDEMFLATKVALILGISGACRSGELCKLTTKNIKKHGEVLVVNMKDSQQNTDKVFVIQEELTTVVQKYQALRPKDVDTDRFFLKYRDGKCIRQVIGLNKISSMPREIATFLKLPNPKSYTGHCFRKSSTEYPGVNVITGNKRKKGKLGTDTENVIDSTVDAQSEVEKIVEIDKKVNKQKNETVRDHGDTASEAIQDIQVEIEENPHSSLKSLWNVRAFNSLASSRLSELEMEYDKESIDLSEEDPIHIKSEVVDETIDSRPQGDLQVISQPSVSNEKVQVSTDEKNTTIRVAGKTINIIFKNCTNVGNVTINIIKN